MARRPLSLERQQDAERLKNVWDNFRSTHKAEGKKVTQEDVSEACGWSTQGAFSAYLNARTPLNLDALIKLSTFFSINPAEISPSLAADIKAVSSDVDEDNNKKSVTKRTGRWVPVKAYSKMGEDGYYHDMGYLGDGGDGYVPSFTAGPNAYAVRGNGTSMYPEIRHGWYAVCDPDAPPIPTEFVEVQFKDGKRTIKEYISVANGVLHLLGINGQNRLMFDISDIDAIVPIIDIVPPSRHMYEIPLRS
ncbi:LexA family transcriptional regulator [uncultured Acinetobacter sp.]|uniref:LexA family transcriptional regulator n=1 Tax=uncultured Acinetobacter sp. TaxID=165433 RepID=UPI002587AE62|nr:LexA family transcriptional regulator [uncultured Acinetobacter sp.]